MASSLEVMLIVLAIVLSLAIGVFIGLCIGFFMKQETGLWPCCNVSKKHKARAEPAVNCTVWVYPSTVKMHTKHKCKGITDIEVQVAESDMSQLNWCKDCGPRPM